MSRGAQRVLGCAVALTAILVVVTLGLLFVRTRAMADEARGVPALPVPTQTAAAGVPTVAFMGDSYSAGTGSSGFNTRFTTLVSAHEGWSSMDFAYGGTGYMRSVTRDAQVGCGASVCPQYGLVIPHVKKFDPVIVVVSGGRNDVGEDTADVDRAVAAFYRDLRRALPRATIYATSPIWDSRKPPQQLSMIQTAVRTNVAAIGGTYLDIGEPLKGKSKLIAKDGVHPNDRGHSVVALAIEVALSTARKS